MFHELMFQISAQSIESIQSYWSASVGYWIWVLMVVRANDLKCSLMFWINYLVTLEFPFPYPLLYNPPFFTLWASFSPFSFRESERSPRVRVLLEIFKRRDDLAWFFKIFHSIEVGWVRKNFLSMKTQTSHLFSQLKAFFPPTSKLFLSSNSMKHTFSPRIAKTHFHLNLMKDISKSNETCFFMILHENIIIWSHV